MTPENLRLLVKRTPFILIRIAMATNKGFDASSASILAITQIARRALRFRHVYLVALLCTLSHSSSSAGDFSFTPLGHLSGGACCDSYATAVSADGSVVVGRSTSANYHQAFRWTRETGMVGLGNLPGNGFSEARGVSADGSVVVGWSEPLFPSRPEAFRWTSSTGMVGLGRLPGGTLSEAYDISADGSVVVGRGSSAARPLEAFRWTSTEGMQGLRELPGQGFAYAARGISADGSTIVGYANSMPGVEAFRWTSTDGLVGLGFLPGGFPSSEADDVSADGSVIVGHSPSGNTDGHEAFRWTSDSGMVGLGDLPGGDFFSFASGVSADGSLVVGRAHTGGQAGGYEAFLWTPTLGMVNLRQFLIDNGVTGLETWQLTTAFDVSPDGRTIVGTGHNGEWGEAWMATIPEPPMIGLTAIGTFTLLVLLWRRVPLRRHLQ